MKIPSNRGKCSDSSSGISLDGDIGYPAKNLQPAINAASTHASFPDQKHVLGLVISTVSPDYLACIADDLI
jgi:hypothetical protein